MSTNLLSPIGRPLGFITGNGHDFGDTARGQRPDGTWRNTPFYYHDDLRIPRQIQALQETVKRRQQEGNPIDFIVLEEIWTTQDQRLVRDCLKPWFPYSTLSSDLLLPAQFGGIGKELTAAYKKWPVDIVDDIIDKAVNWFSGAHYGLEDPGTRMEMGALLSFFAENIAPRLVRRFVTKGAIWGAGSVFLSAHPIVAQEMDCDPHAVQWNSLACRGSLNVTAVLPNGREIDIEGVHDPEGPTKSVQKTRAARALISQARSQRGRAYARIGDYNVSRNFDCPEDPRNAEYQQLGKILNGMKDLGGEPTYEDPNFFQEGQGAYVGDMDPRKEQLDYIWYNEFFDPIEYRVLKGNEYERFYFVVPDGKHKGKTCYASDHFFLEGHLRLYDEMARVYSFPTQPSFWQRRVQPAVAAMSTFVNAASVLVV